MTLIPVMWTVWLALVLILAAVWLYRSRLERDEEDQIFIDDAFSNERAAQAAIVAKVNKVQPILRTMTIITGVATLFVIGYYIYDFINQFK
jgi:cbb3-type cytochrome oxidase subunit 3